MSRRKLLIANEKKHYKMYKSGKQWFFAGMGVVAGLFGAGSSIAVSADEKPGASLDLSQSEDLLATQKSATIPGSTSTASSSTLESTSTSTQSTSSKSTSATSSKSETQSNSTSTDKDSTSKAKASESTSRSASLSLSTSQSKSTSVTLKAAHSKSTSSSKDKTATDDKQSKQNQHKAQKVDKQNTKQDENKFSKDVKQTAKDNQQNDSRTSSRSTDGSNQSSEQAQINDSIDASLSSSTAGSLTESTSGSLSVSLSDSIFVSDSRKRDKDSASNSQSLAVSLSDAKQAHDKSMAAKAASDATQTVTYTDEDGNELAPTEKTTHNVGDPTEIPAPKNINGYIIDDQKTVVIAGGVETPIAMFLALGNFKSIDELMKLINESGRYLEGETIIKYVYKKFDNKINITGKDATTPKGTPVTLPDLVETVTNSDGTKGDISNVTSTDFDQVDWNKTGSYTVHLSYFDASTLTTAETTVQITVTSDGKFDIINNYETVGDHDVIQPKTTDHTDNFDGMEAPLIPGYILDVSQSEVYLGPDPKIVPSTEDNATMIKLVDEFNDFMENSATSFDDIKNWLNANEELKDLFDRGILISMQFYWDYTKQESQIDINAHDDHTYANHPLKPADVIDSITTAAGEEGNISGVTWNADDGAVDWSTPGEYEVTVSYYDSNSMETVTTTVTITVVEDEAELNADSTAETDANHPLTIDDIHASAKDADGIPADASEITWNADTQVDWNQPGTYVVTVTYTDPKTGDVLTKDVTITVNEDSESISNSTSQSISESKSISASGSDSTSQSVSTSKSSSASGSESISQSISTSKSDSMSASNSTSESDSRSTSTSKSDSASDSESVSQSISTSVSDSNSSSDSDSTSKSRSTSTSNSDSTSISDSDSTSKSRSI